MSGLLGVGQERSLTSTLEAGIKVKGKSGVVTLFRELPRFSWTPEGHGSGMEINSGTLLGHKLRRM